jgi:hypothetical protein
MLKSKKCLGIWHGICKKVNMSLFLICAQKIIRDQITKGVLLTCLLLLSGCAFVFSSKHHTETSLPYPRAFYVEDFSINLARAVQDAEVSNRTEYLGSLQDLSRRLSAKLRSELMDLAPVYVLKPGDPRPDNGYVIQGDFLTMDAGSPAARTFLGLGLGQTKMFANVQMYLASHTKVPLLRKDTKNIGRVHDFRTEGVTTEGLVLGFNVRTGSGLLMGPPAALHSLNDDADAAAREISRNIRRALGLPIK